MVHLAVDPSSPHQHNLPPWHKGTDSVGLISVFEMSFRTVLTKCGEIDQPLLELAMNYLLLNPLTEMPYHRKKCFGQIFSVVKKKKMSIVIYIPGLKD